MLINNMPRTPDVYRRTQAFNLYAKYRNVSKVGKETGIPIATLFVWKKQDKWDDKIAEVQTNLKEQLHRSEELNGDNKAMADELAKDIANEINSLALMDQKADAAVADGYKTMTLTNVIKTKEFTSKQRRILLGQTQDEGESDSAQPLEKISLTEYRRLKGIMDRLDPGWENDEGESVNNDNSVAGN